MGEHIPGPWRITGPYHYEHDLHPSYRIDASHTLIASVLDHVVSGEANARLIAAAPTMYEYIVRCAQQGDTEAQKIIGGIDANP